MPGETRFMSIWTMEMWPSGVPGLMDSGKLEKVMIYLL